MGRASPLDDEEDLQITVHPGRGPPADHHRSPTRPPRRPPPPTTPIYQPFKKHFPWLVPLFVVANIVLFAIAMYINDCPRNSHNCLAADILGRFAFQNLKENPLLGPSGSTLQLMGALEVKKVVENHEVWRLISCTWLHAGLFHVLANMLSLVFVGIRLEQEFGFVRIGLLYVISGIGGSLSSSLFIRTTISVGASGALFGLLGGMLSELLTNWTIYANKFAALLTLILIIAINLAVGILPHVDNYAHIGGFITGFLLGFVVLIRPQYAWVRQRHTPPRYHGNSSKPKYKMYQFVLLVLSLIILTASFTIGMVLLLRGVDGNQYCSWCHYMSCVPTSLWKCKPDEVYCEVTHSANFIVFFLVLTFPLILIPCLSPSLPLSLSHACPYTIFKSNIQ
ncbi:RHOMBOID-like protein 2 isoform X1 [Camellia sinensis]|uniref:RHOMBOID-like protein 2 isoform X1 n=1 Tax=Camellia sinensis TaxID=4442 RepID=UPI00103605C7|nr:RHOMBOID-like protein 2 isoform X1 [Camellia sinensis]